MDRAEACRVSGTTFVTSVSIDPVVVIAALKVAAVERRDFSNLIDVALSEYAKVHGPIAGAEGDIIDRFQAALGDLEPAARNKFLQGLERLLANATRAKRRNAA